jgi:hypothetical protein
MPTPDRFDEELIDKIRRLPPDKIAEVDDFVEFLRQRGDGRSLGHAVTKLSEDAFLSVWDNHDDAEYDRL